MPIPVKTNPRMITSSMLTAPNIGHHRGEPKNDVPTTCSSQHDFPIVTADAPMTAQDQKLFAGERLRFASLLVKFYLPESYFSSASSVPDDPPSSKRVFECVFLRSC